MKSFPLAIICLISLTCPVFGEFFDFSNGKPEGINSNCPPSGPFPGTWTEEDASQYETATSGPLTGKVLVSGRGVQSCLTTENSIVIEGNYSFQMSVYMPVAQNLQFKIIVFIVDELDTSTPVTMMRGSDKNEDWFSVDVTVPASLTYPNNYKVEIWVTTDIDFVAIRWFGISDETLPPPEAPMTTESTTENSTTENTTETSDSTDATTETTENTTDTTEEITTDATTSGISDTTEGTTEITTTESSQETTYSTEQTTEFFTTEVTETSDTTVNTQTTTETTENETTERTTTTTTAPPPPPSDGQIFPELWSVLFGISFGMLIMCLIFLSMFCCWWIIMAKKKKSNHSREEPHMAPLPRLEVLSERSNSRPMRITASESVWDNGHSRNWARR
ncbi:Hypothetical predicted protein [Cloeon dipterum]|uniref:MAM domain-containing protein n=1 Tax=Cloeon dipterum TaxID=197152 RepID=A0A8S1DZT6_9INSE|nr:Hypothetical predicted protein [Cloeon dipterum]